MDKYDTKEQAEEMKIGLMKNNFNRAKQRSIKLHETRHEFGRLCCGTKQESKKMFSFIKIAVHAM